LGNLSVANRSPDLHQKIFAALAQLASKKNPELHFTVGEAFSSMIGGWQSKTNENRNHPKKNTTTDSEKVDNPTFKMVMDKIFSDYANPLRPDYAQASCIWLLSITKFLGHLPFIKVSSSSSKVYDMSS